MVWYNILEFNVPLDTVLVISETGEHNTNYIQRKLTEYKKWP